MALYNCRDSLRQISMPEWLGDGKVKNHVSRVQNQLLFDFYQAPTVNDTIIDILTEEQLADLYNSGFELNMSFNWRANGVANFILGIIFYNSDGTTANATQWLVDYFADVIDPQYGAAGEMRLYESDSIVANQTAGGALNLKCKFTQMDDPLLENVASITEKGYAISNQGILNISSFIGSGLYQTGQKKVNKVAIHIHNQAYFDMYYNVYSL